MGLPFDYWWVLRVRLPFEKDELKLWVLYKMPGILSVFGSKNVTWESKIPRGKVYYMKLIRQVS